MTRKKGLLSFDFLFQNAALIFSIFFVAMIYGTIIRPSAEEQDARARLLADQNPELALEPQRSIFIILRNYEQQICLTLMLWATLLLTARMWQLGREHTMLQRNYLQIEPGERILPEDSLLHYKDLESTLEHRGSWKDRILPKILLASLHRFHSTRSIQDASQAIKESSDLAMEELENNISLIRYIAWAIPSIGFIGTVRGIGEALAQAEQAIQGDISGVTASLGLAFNSTLIALFLSIILMFMLHLMQSRNDNLILEIQEYCNKNLLAVMKIPPGSTSSAILPARELA